MKKIHLIVLLFLVLGFAPSQVLAFNFPSSSFNFPSPSLKPISTPKPLPQIKVKEIKVDGKYKKNKSIVELEFSNLDKVKFVGLTLTYTHNGIDEGIVDSIFPSGIKKARKEIFLGTCSTGVCKSHLNVINIKLKIHGFYNNNQPFSQLLDIK